ncbi:MAG: hypothetical protein A3C58_02120 [Candidatus Staskawiczbacteria bacterium RIFCSPHIGHO2_02_FULL_34_10]|uniref:HTH cro/C1-type domain-containing protein n=1 Tax=Candidatus Staskawiczbacteria bacterium RIFCSPHIGHO2_02_FULL_34_10 TaxID=1802205 RepID=A0A1G2HY77_9BACT|nr:MAG: hypothetical protein A3C58_02120 [Candidatus Staskawiczbacteria bacterium RIFCSPHIGHO2_02_FULL_34_10]
MEDLEMKKNFTAGEFLRNIRNKKAESQAKIARRAGLTNAAINKIEGGSLKVSIKSIDRISTGYQLTNEEREQLIVLCGFSEEDLLGDFYKKETKISDERLIFELLLRPKKIQNRIFKVIDLWNSLFITRK